MKVNTKATLEDTSIGALAFVKAEISTHGSKTYIGIKRMDNKSRYALTLIINTEDIQRAVMQDQLDDGR